MNTKELIKLAQKADIEGDLELADFIDRELLAIYLSIRHFRYFLEGRNFHIYTDHITINAICLLYAYIIALLEKKTSLRVDLVETSLHWP